MSEEMFDIVDAKDQVIGTRSRADTHRLGLRHRAIHLLVFDSRERLFLQKRSPAKDENPGQWDSSVAGHVDSGEDYDGCVIREAHEEIGLRLGATPDLLFKLEASAVTGMEFCHVYRTTHDGPFRLNPDEISAGGWFEAEYLDRALAQDDPRYTDVLMHIWRRLRGLSDAV